MEALKNFKNITILCAQSRYDKFHNGLHNVPEGNAL